MVPATIRARVGDVVVPDSVVLDPAPGTVDAGRESGRIIGKSALSVAGGSIPDMAPNSPDAPFVGRARELSRLEQLLEQASAGSAGGVLVAGDAGVGKTRLTGELVRRAAERGIVAVVGDSVDLGAGGLPYLPFAEALTGL